MLETMVRTKDGKITLKEGIKKIRGKQNNTNFYVVRKNYYMGKVHCN